MIILLTGPSGVGKTDVSWALLPLFEEMTFLDCDWFASRLPFDWKNQSDLESVFQGLALMIEFHLKQGRRHFVIPLTLEMAEYLKKYQHYFTQWQLPIHAFRLRCSEITLENRIRARNRIHWQKQQELEQAPIAQARFDILFPDNAIFRLIDTTQLTEDEVAKMALIKIDENN